MGGNALKNTTTRRYNKDEYFAVVEEVMEKIADFQLIDRFDLIPSYNSKESFGDADILYGTVNNQCISVDKIKETFAPNEIVKNSNVISFDYKQFQIDLIHQESADYIYALNYYAFNDLGNIIGKLAKRFGLSHGHKGLYLPLKDADNVFENILISTDHTAVLEFLDLDSDKFTAGFDTLDDIFAFASSSMYYNPDLYELENITSAGRMRDKKRDTYKKFLEFGNKFTGATIPYTKGSDKTVFLQQIFAAFPHTRARFKQAVDKLTVQRALKEKFNGQIVAGVTNLSGKELGMFMKVLKEDFNFKPEILLYLSLDKIKANILAKFNIHIIAGML